MGKTSRKAETWFVVMFFLLAWVSAAHATPPSTPITVELSLSHAPGLNEWAILTVTVTSLLDAPGTSVELMLPQDVVAPTTSWSVDLTANTPVTFLSPVFAQKTGNLTLSARAIRPASSGAVWGDMKSIPLNIESPASGPSQHGWTVSEVPVALQAKVGDATVLSMEPTPFAFTQASAEAPSLQPSVTAQQTLGSGSTAPQSPGNVTLTGVWHYGDRSNVERPIDQQLIEIRKGDGSALSPSAFCFTEINGSFSCTFAHPGTTMRVWVRSWANFNVPGGTNRLGVFSGNEVAGGCGSDSIACSYPVQTPEVSCADGATCNVGTWVVSSATGEPWIGAHWMTQDLIRSWKKLFFDTKHGTGSSAGPGRINYPVPTGHGTHAHVPPADGWISIEPPNQQSADIVTHEYGHVVMANLWQTFTPNWPTSDCPSPHYIDAASGPGCAFSEGWANFWAWYSNEFYDGDNSPANDGPIFNWPSGASTNMETRDGGTYQAGDQVEGNIAAVFGDLFDSNNDGPATGPADRLSDGIQHVWHTVSSQSDNNFAEWWMAYWSTFAHAACPALDVIKFNSIPYSLGQCLNQPPNTPANLGQFKSNGSTAIGVGGGTDETTVVLKGTVGDPDGNTVKLQVEVRPLGTGFSNTATQESSLVSSGSVASVTVAGLTNSPSYHWQARAVDSQGAASGWVAFGGNAESAADFTVTSAPPSITSLVASPALPQPAGTAITWTATATGGVAPLQYAFYLYTAATNSWSLPQPFSTSNTWTWTPAQPGQYAVQVWVKNNGSTAAYDTWAGSGSFTIGTPPTVTLTASPTPPQPAGTAITWTATATGGVAPLQYAFYLYTAATNSWSLRQPFSTSNTWTWTPAQPGQYAVQVWVKNNGSTAAYDTWAGSGSFTISP